MRKILACVTTIVGIALTIICIWNHNISDLGWVIAVYLIVNLLIGIGSMGTEDD